MNSPTRPQILILDLSVHVHVSTVDGVGRGCEVIGKDEGSREGGPEEVGWVCWGTGSWAAPIRLDGCWPPPATCITVMGRGILVPDMAGGALQKH